MRYLSYLLLVLLIGNLALAQDVSMTIDIGPLNSVQSPYGKTVQVSNYRPVVGEAFKVDFTVNFSGSETPDFPTFTPVGLEVIERLKTSNRISIVNGVQARTTVFRYSMVAERVGTAYLNNIKLSVGSKSYQAPNKQISIVKTRPKPQVTFLAAEPSKDEVYPGEGFDINYYRYIRQHSMAEAGAAQEKKTPSFKNIIKRVRSLRVNEPQEYDSINGIPYIKQKVYSVRAFAEKPGEVSIDPMKVEFQYRMRSFGSIRVKSLTSKRVKVPVKALPQPIPNNFIGLVGKHEFILNPPRNKYIVNDPIEITLEIAGDGALEKLELPPLINDPNVESFDSQTEIQLDRGESKGRIKYSFTYLARSPITLPARKISFSTLNPETGEYETNEINMPEIVVGGKAQTPTMNQGSVSSPQDTTAPTVPSKSDEQVRKELAASLIAPDFSKGSGHFNFIVIVNFIIGLIGLIIWLSIWIRKPKVYKVDPRAIKLIDKMKKSGITYSSIHHLMLFLNNNEPLVDITLGELLQQSNLSDDAKKYFSNLLTMSEKQNYGDSLAVELKFNSKFFSEFVELLKK